MEELKQEVEKLYKGLTIKYTEVYHLDYEVDENTGIRKENKVKCYTKKQVNCNLKALKEAYLKN